MKAKTNTQQAVDRLRDMILSNTLPAGSNHLESELADMLGMSRTPVREATLILEAQGLVEVKPRHGVKVQTISPADMAEIYDIFTELESLSAERAAERNLDADKLVAVEASIEDMEAALAKDDREAWGKADEIFHMELVRLGGSRRIANVVSTYNDQVKRVRSLTLYLRPAPTKSIEDHRAVLNAIKKGDASKARQLHRDHRIRAKNMLVGLLEQYGFHNV